MKSSFLFLSLLLFTSYVFGQPIYKEFDSKKLEDTRRIKIQLPRNYNKNTEKHYPIIMVLDGDYLFEPVAGNVDYFSYWEDIPESIVVGIMQGRNRYSDCGYDEDTYMPGGESAKFFEFLGMELLPYIDKEYRTAKFIIGVGHDLTANFLNYYLFKDPVLFNGFISLSPDLAPEIDNRMAGRIPNVKQKLFYYLATGTDDVIDLKEGTERLNRSLAPLKSDNFHLYFDNFEDATHYSLVGRGIPNALEKIFSVYRPISKKEYNEVLLTTTTPLHQYLNDKYDVIRNLFGLDNAIRINDYIAIGTAAEKRKQWETLEEIGKLAKKQYPDKVLGDYFLGRFYQETGNSKKALHQFRGAFDKEEVQNITVDLLMDLADQINAGN